MSKITPLMTSLHVGHKAEERIKCIDNMLFNKCEDTKDTILQAFWWYRKRSVPLDKVEQAREEIQKLRDEEIITDQRSEAPMEQYITAVGEGLELALDVLDELIGSEG